MFLQINPEALSTQLGLEKNTNTINAFVNDFEIRYMIMEKTK